MVLSLREKRKTSSETRIWWGSLSIILVFHHHGNELQVADLTIAILVSHGNHVINMVIGYLQAQVFDAIPAIKKIEYPQIRNFWLFCLLQFGFGNHSVAIAIEHFEGRNDLFLANNFVVPHHFHELFEFNYTRSIRVSLFD